MALGDDCCLVTTSQPASLRHASAVLHTLMPIAAAKSTFVLGGDIECAVISRYKDTRCKDIANARTMQLGTMHCILTTVGLLTRDILM